jgi:hypothetical protein
MPTETGRINGKKKFGTRLASKNAEEKDKEAQMRAGANVIKKRKGSHSLSGW